MPHAFARDRGRRSPRRRAARRPDPRCLAARRRGPQARRGSRRPSGRRSPPWSRRNGRSAHPGRAGDLIDRGVPPAALVDQRAWWRRSPAGGRAATHAASGLAHFASSKTHAERISGNTISVTIGYISACHLRRRRLPDPDRQRPLGHGHLGNLTIGIFKQAGTKTSLLPAATTPVTPPGHAGRAASITAPAVTRFFSGSPPTGRAMRSSTSASPGCSQR